MKKLLLLLLCVPLIGFGQENSIDNKLDGYTKIAEIKPPTTVDQNLFISKVHITPDDKYFIVRMGFKPTYFAVYELETQEYITLFKVPGAADLLFYKDNTLYTSNGKKKKYELKIDSKYPEAKKLKHSLFNEINPEGCYYLKLESTSKSTGIECQFHLNYAFCWEYIGKVLTIKKKGCISGDCVNGKGTYNFRSGDKYVGQWKNKKINGLGTYTYAEGHKYVGEFKDGKKHGQGTYTFPDGEKYVGEWKNDMKNGFGTWTHPEGDKYVGEWKNDRINGLGTYTFPSGEKYVGEWKNGEFIEK